VLAIGLLVLLIGLYWKIVPDMVMDWYKDDNYSTVFLVRSSPGISSAWLAGTEGQAGQTRSPGLLVIVLAAVQLLVAWLGTSISPCVRHWSYGSLVLYSSGSGGRFSVDGAAPPVPAVHGADSVYYL